MSETCYFCEGTGGLQRLTDRSRIKCPVCEGEGHQARHGDRFVSRGEVQLLERIAALEQQLVGLQAEVARLREALPPAAKLKMLAAWLDLHDDEFGSRCRDVQLDLRIWADRIDAALATPGKGEE